MRKWVGKWRFNNVMDGHHGLTGSATVSAPNEFEAREAIRCAASREMFGTTMMQRYVEIQNISIKTY